ncbi:CD209 antigen-like [Protopterus annectens]|uniref:CD209 antigen-like n=1 Tax=Protopterus annectens TaxID=7888 RepID=UPI001CFB212F|nr:CD209 antigen-like [Protopterus annectens]
MAYNGPVNNTDARRSERIVNQNKNSVATNNNGANPNETQKEVVKNVKQPRKLSIAFIITVIILLPANIALIIWNTQLSNNLNQSIQTLGEKDKKSADLNISYGNFTNELKEIKGNFYKLINDIQSVCEGKDLPDLKIPDTLLSRNLHQSILNLARKQKNCVDLNISSGNLNTELQENKRNFAKLVNNIQSVCEGKELHDLIIRDSLLSRNLHESIQNLAKKGTQVKCCPPQWELFRLHCYYFSAESKDWFDAQAHCKSLSADLVVIKSKEEQEFTQLARTDHSRFYWIGMTDKDTEGSWRWVDGTPCNSASGNPVFWHSNQPNNIGNEDCAVMYPDATWHDYSCSDKYRWICEKTANTCSFKGEF